MAAALLMLSLAPCPLLTTCPHPALSLPSPCHLPAISLPSPCHLSALTLPSLQVAALFLMITVPLDLAEERWRGAPSFSVSYCVGYLMDR